MSTKSVILTGALALACTTFAANTSDALFMYVNPKTSSFWHTAPASTFDVPVTFPEGATRATLSVSGVLYAQTHSIDAAGRYELVLPAASDSSSENTYTLVLDFYAGDEATGNSVTGIVSVIDSGNQSGGIGKTRCLSPSVGTWKHLPQYRATFPVPYGTTSLTYNGSEIDTKLNGDQGFCTVPSQAGTYVLSVDGEEYEATLDAAKDMVIIFR